MAITLVDISSYVVLAYGGPNGNNGADAMIGLGIPNAFGFLRFLPAGAAIPPNSVATHSSGARMFYVNYRYDQFANVLDILRNEKPVKLFFRDDTMAAHLTTSDEPVGEGE